MDRQISEADRSLPDLGVRHEANEALADARPQAAKSRRRIRCNTLRIFRGRERSRCLVIIRRSRGAMSVRLQERDIVRGVNKDMQGQVARYHPWNLGLAGRRMRRCRLAPQLIPFEAPLEWNSDSDATSKRRTRQLLPGRNAGPTVAQVAGD